MASVFLSYARDDAAKARIIAAALEQAGQDVWWDRQIKGGAQYSVEIEAALDGAQAVVVLWSAGAVKSPWVRDEAAAGRDSGRLVPALLDGTLPPLGFRQYQNVDLSRFNGSRKSPEFERLRSAIEALGGGCSPAAIQPAAPKTKSRQRSRHLPVILAGLAVLAIALAFAGWKLTRPASGVPVVAIAAADGSPATTDLARKLLVNLGSVQTAAAESIRLVDGAAGESPNADFTFKLSAARGRPEASMLLRARGKDTILWSKDFKPPTASQADLEEQLTYGVGLIAQCLSDTAGSKRRLDVDQLKLYLSGCTQVALSLGSGAFDYNSLVELTAKAPWFEPGWSKLLTAEIDTLGPRSAASETNYRDLRNHVDQARKLHPGNSAIRLAAIALLPPSAFRNKIKQMQSALRAEPKDAALLAEWSRLLGMVGRWNSAVPTARDAARLDPFSAALSGNHIMMLAYQGNTEAALEELAKAERRWPDSPSMVETRFQIHFRYGDPREAIRMIEAGYSDTNITAKQLLTGVLDPTPANLERSRSLVRSGMRRNLDVAGPIQGMARFGLEEELYATAGEWLRPDMLTYSALFRPPLRNFRKDPRFMRIVDRLGLVDYWRTTGQWPDFCFDPDLPYDCKVEAAKLSG